MSFCGQCGEALELGARFCGSCGATIESTAAASGTSGTSATVAPADTAFHAVFQPIPTNPPAAEEEWVQPARRAFSPAVIVGCLILVLLAAGATILLLQDDDPATSPAATTPASAVVTTTSVTTTSGPTTSTTTSAPTTVAATIPPAPAEQLAATSAADHAAVEAMVGRWVPQLSAKKAGTIDDGKTYDLAAIVAFHQQLHTEYDALLLFSGDYVYQTTDLWVSIAPESFATAQGALAWCVSEDIGRDDCFAKLITHDDTITDSVQMQP